MRKNGFNRLLLSYFPVWFVISLSLLFITYLTLSEMSQRSAVRGNDMLTHHTMQTIDEALREIDSTMLREILENNRIKAIFGENGYGYDRFTDYQAAAALREIMAANPLIDSMYLYRVTGQSVITPTSVTDINSFGDKEFVGRNLTSLRPHRWLGKRLYSEEPDGIPAEVVSLVKFANLADKSMMVVNVRADSLGALIRKMYDSELYFAELVDEDGAQIASKEQGQPAKPSMAEDFSEGNSGKPLSSVQSDYSGWTVRSGIYSNNMLEWVSSLFYVWIAFGFLVILLGFIWLFFVTRRNYKPILNMVERISAYSRQKSHDLQLADSKDEFKLIEKTIENLLDESSVLHEENKENLIYRKRHVFRAMLEEGPAVQGERWAKELERLGIQSSFRSLRVALIEIDRSTEFEDSYSLRDQHLLKYTLSTVCREIADGESMEIWAEWIDRQRLAVLYWSATSNEVESRVIAFCEKLLDWVERNLMFTITIGLGSGRATIEQIADSYLDAVEALTYKLSLGTNRLISQADVEAMPQGEMFRQMQIIRDICQMFRTGDSAWERHFHELYKALRIQLFSRDDLISLMSYLIHNLHKEVMELPAEFQEIWSSDVQASLKRTLAQKETIDDIYKDYVRLLTEAFEQMREVREARNHHQLIHQIKAYIDDHYANPELSLALLSGEFHVNASYISRLFKETFGEKFNDYVAEIRIEKAVERLKSTEEPIHEIAEAVGYTHPLTFIRVFKKVMGSTPGYYRKDIK